MASDGEGDILESASIAHAHQALITAGEKHDARMIVVGSHGESPLKGAIIGSTPYKLVQLSEVPVLVVRP
jgi:nucleotide-binding universal stress UspA family protein